MIHTHSDEVLVPIGQNTITPGCMVQHAEVDYVGTVISVIDHKVTVLWPDDASFNVVAEMVRTVIRRGTRKLLEDFEKGRKTWKVNLPDIRCRIHSAMEMLKAKGKIHNFKVDDPVYDPNDPKRVNIRVQYTEDPTPNYKVLDTTVVL